MAEILTPLDVERLRRRQACALDHGHNEGPDGIALSVYCNVARLLDSHEALRASDALRAEEVRAAVAALANIEMHAQDRCDGCIQTIKYAHDVLNDPKWNLRHVLRETEPGE